MRETLALKPGCPVFGTSNQRLVLAARITIPGDDSTCPRPIHQLRGRKKQLPIDLNVGVRA